MISKLIRVAAAAILASCVTLEANTKSQTILDQRVSFVMENFDEEVILRRFADRFKIPIGFEVIPGEKSNQRYRSISIRVENGTVRDVLDAFINADPRYRWDEMPDGIINISPKEPVEGILDVRVSSIYFSEVNLEKFGFALLEVTEVKARLEGIGVKPGRTRLTTGARKEPSQLSIHLTDVTVREILNELLRRQHTSYWRVERYGDRNEYIQIGL